MKKAFAMIWLMTYLGIALLSATLTLTQQADARPNTGWISDQGDGAYRNPVLSGRLLRSGMKWKVEETM